jgi:hypothetical protein
MIGIIVNPSTRLRGYFEETQLNGDVLQQCDISSASLRSLQLSHIDLSGRDLNQVSFAGSFLEEADFSNSNLEGAVFHNSKLRGANLSNANLTQARFENADLTQALLVNVKLERAIIVGANLNKANVRGANFFEATLNRSSMQFLEGAYNAKDLVTTTIGRDADVLYFPTVIRSWPERWVDWEKIRVVGRLPLFGASYAGLISIPFYVYVVGVYNEKINAVREWISQSVPPAAAPPILKHLHTEPFPESFSVLLAATIFLAIASTIYVLACPSRIKEFSADQWRYELGHSLVHYWPEAWKQRPLRLLSALCFLLGGLGALYVLIPKVLRAAIILYHSSSS